MLSKLRLSLPLLLVCLLAPLPARAQTGTGKLHEYFATCSGTDTGAGKTCSIQIPAGANRWVLMKTAFAQCGAACTITQARDGTAATATSTTIRKANPNGSWVAAPVATVYNASNVGSGTPVGPDTLSLAASPSYMPLDVKSIILEKGSGAAQNYSITITVTGTYLVTFAWEERSSF